MRTPHLEPRPYDGELCCHGRTWPDDPPCTNAPAWHVAWLLAPHGRFSLVCGEHMAPLADAYDFVDRHPATIMCAMPGTGWFLGKPSRCVLAPTRKDERCD